MSTSFSADIADGGKKFKLVFETDLKENFKYVLDAARDCIDGKPMRNSIMEMRKDCVKTIPNDYEEKKNAIWALNLKKFEKGEFGNLEKFETMVAYWKAQDEAGYPNAKENVRYFEQMLRLPTKAMESEDTKCDG